MKRSHFYLTLFAVVVCPFLLSLITIHVAFERSKSLQFCGSCHIMTPYINDLKNGNRDTLASKHYQHRWISKDQCAVCHTDYRFLGTIDAKLRGLRHIVVFYLEPHAHPKGLYKSYSNDNCLQCHGGTKRFMENPVHISSIEQIQEGEMSCLDCHRPIHPEDAKQ